MTRMAPLPPGPTPAPRTRSAARWAAAIAVATAAALASAEWHGRTSRRTFEPPGELARRRAAGVTSAADALLVWRESGARGRRLVLLTGQWSGPRSGGARTGARAAFGSGAPGDPLTPASAVYWTARLGVARAIDVVMPSAPFEARRAADAGHEAFRPEDGAYRHDLHGFALRFSLPRAFVPPREPALVLVEPTWFGAGAPPDPLAWLASLGVRTELALVALEDPAATDADRRSAADYARSAGLPRLQLARTRSP